MVRERAAAGVTIADMWLNGDETAELIVEYLALADRRRADRLLTRWAKAVGYDRLWLPDRLVTFESGRPLGSAQVVCPTCGMVWEDEGPDFWNGRAPAPGASRLSARSATATSPSGIGGREPDASAGNGRRRRAQRRTRATPGRLS